MPNDAISLDFEHYKIYYITSATKPFPAVISCFHNGAEVGVLRFITAGQKLTNPTYDGNKITLDYPIERFHDVHSILLHEKPLSLYLAPERHWGGVTTSQLEATGEMETGTEFFTRVSDGVLRALKEMDAIQQRKVVEERTTTSLPEDLR